MPGASPLVTAHRRLAGLPLGREVVSAGYRLAAPYFSTIPARLGDVEPGRATAWMPARPWTRNHLGGVHAIALCNLVEFTMGAAVEATVPPTHRWIPQGMTVAYPARARGTMSASATLALPASMPDRLPVTVAVRVADQEDTTVLEGHIDVWVTARPR